MVPVPIPGGYRTIQGRVRPRPRHVLMVWIYAADAGYHGAINRV
jgi:hypothetical protein